MNSIRVRIAVVLVVSITVVISLTTAATIFVVRRSAVESFVQPIASQLDIMATMAAALPSGAASRFFSNAPPPGASRKRLTRLLRSGLTRLDDHHAIVVTRPPQAAQPVASLELSPGRWLTVPIVEEPPPPETFWILGGWMLMIFVGVVGTALVVAQRVTRPLVLLEAFAEGVRPEGELEHVPETGPAEVKATARALNRLSQNLRRAVESRMRLVAAAGHDLRTPMTRMRLRAEFLDDAERDKWLHDLDELERIADSAILLVREEVGGGDREPMLLDELIRGIGRELAAIGLRVAVLDLSPAQIHGSTLALTRALRNLMINAATHGRGAEVSLVVRGDHAVLTIDDRGPGIPADLLDRVFEPFFRVDVARRQVVPGAGLGLAIAREIIGRSEGCLKLENRPGGGLRQQAMIPIWKGSRDGTATDGSKPVRGRVVEA